MPDGTAPVPEGASFSALRLFAALSLVLPLLAYGIFGIYRHDQMRDEMAVRLDRSLRVAHEHALKVLDTTESMLARAGDLAAAPAAELRLREPQLHAQLREITGNKRYLNGVWIIGADGAAIATSRFSPPPPMDVRDRDYFVWHQQGNLTPFLSPPMVSRSTGESVVDLSAPRRDPGGTFGGVVNISLRSAYFHEFHADLVAEEPGLAITLFREDGSLYVRTPALSSTPDRLSPDSPVMQRLRAGQRDGVADGVSSVDGRDRLIRYRKVGEHPLYLGIGMDRARITRNWLGEMGRLAAFGLPLWIGLLVTAGIALRRSRESQQAAARLREETAARRRSEEALLQAQKLEALGRLTGGVAHDFNNALMVISNNVFLIKRKHPDAAGPNLDSISRAVQSATKLTRQLLAFSRRQPLAPQHIDLVQQLPNMADLLLPVLGSQVRLAIEVAPETPAIVVDTAELELALINLAINARDAMPEGGHFRLDARPAAPDELPPGLAGPMVRVTASDTGTGIAPELLTKVFEPFFTTKPMGQGTGLGLSQVWGLCQRAGGLATVASTPGEGTQVSLWLPVAASPRPPAEAMAGPAAGWPGLAVLLVEDNDAVATGLVPVLESMGCRVTRMDRATTARDWLDSAETLPGLLLTDVMMPGDIDGLGLAKWARARHPGLPIVVMTGYAEQIDAIAALGFEIVAKPCSADQLSLAIGRVLRPEG